MKNFLSLLIFLLFLFGTAASQNEDPEVLFDDAEYFFAMGDFEEATALFTKLVNLYPDNANFNFRTGMSYLNIPGKETLAIPYLEKATKNILFKYKQKEYTESHAPHHTYFYLGNAYRINNDLEKALESYEKFQDIKDFEKKYNIRMVDIEVKACERAKIIKDSPLKIVKTNPGKPVNSQNSDYSPILSVDESIIVFMNTQRFYEAIMFSTKVDGSWTTPMNITPQIGSDGDMIPTSLSRDGKELFLVKKDKNNSDIYYSKWDGTFWSKAVPLNSNINTRNDETFASVSMDGKQLFFTSNRKGAIGGLDIFVSRKQSVGDWGPAENIGPIINTDFDEESPYLSHDGKILFFSSKGHFNMGGFDVFYSPINKYGQFEACLNIGFPINTTGDNLNFFPISDGKTGYLSLFNEEASLGKADIYKIEILSSYSPETETESRFNKSFLMEIINSDSSETISILYDKNTDRFKVMNPKQKEYKISITDFK